MGAWGMTSTSRRCSADPSSARFRAARTPLRSTRIAHETARALLARAPRERRPGGRRPHRRLRRRARGRCRRRALGARLGPQPAGRPLEPLPHPHHDPPGSGWRRPAVPTRNRDPGHHRPGRRRSARSCRTAGGAGRCRGDPARRLPGRPRHGPGSRGRVLPCRSGGCRERRRRSGGDEPGARERTHPEGGAACRPRPRTSTPALGWRGPTPSTEPATYGSRGRDDQIRPVPSAVAREELGPPCGSIRPTVAGDSHRRAPVRGPSGQHPVPRPRPGRRADRCVSRRVLPTPSSTMIGAQGCSRHAPRDSPNSSAGQSRSW